jgi:hydrogenase maturation protease
MNTAPGRHEGHPHPIGPGEDALHASADRAKTPLIPAIVIGVGNEYRHDDGAAIEVIKRLRRRHLPGVSLVITDGEPSRLIDLWESAELAMVIDAIRTLGSDPGRIHQFTVDEAVADPGTSASSHGLGLGEAVELGRALGRMPQRLIILAIEGVDFSVGLGFSPAVADGIHDLESGVLSELARA